MFGQSIQNTVFRLLQPDYCEQRDRKFLLVWKDIPHWMVVDEEMKTLLFSFQDGGALCDILKSHSEFQSHKRQLTRIIRDISTKGVFLTGRNEISEDRILPEPDTLMVPIENVAWNLTHQCNLRCCYCYYRESLSSSNTDELSATEVIAFLKALKPLLSKQATLTVLGGEPLLDPEKLIGVCKAAKQLGMTPLVSTNGTLVDAAFARQARRIDLEVQISLDGPTPEINDPLRGSGTFNRIQQGVSLLQSQGVKTILSMVCCRRNFGALQEFLNLAILWKVPQARFIPLKQMGGAKEQGLEGVSHQEIVTTAWRLLKECSEYRNLLGRDCLTILANTCRQSSRRLSCGTGSQTFLLDADGLLYPCLNLNRPEYAFGNIRDNNFDIKEIWKVSEGLKCVREAVSINNATRVCSQCLVRYWCLGGCRGETAANTGDLSACSVHCGDLRKTIIEIFWILAERPDILKVYKQIH